MAQFLSKYKWKIVGTIIGGMAGFAYYYFIGCNSGTCPIQSHWETSTLYGGLLGFVFVNSPNKNKKNKKEEQLN